MLHAIYVTKADVIYQPTSAVQPKRKTCALIEKCNTQCYYLRIVNELSEISEIDKIVKKFRL